MRITNTKIWVQLLSTIGIALAVAVVPTGEPQYAADAADAAALALCYLAAAPMRRRVAAVRTTVGQ